MMRYTHLQQTYGADSYCPHCLQKMPHVNSLVLDELAHCVISSAGKHHLTPMEFALFKMLYDRYDKIVPGARLNEIIDGWHRRDQIVCDSYLNATLHVIRRALKGSGFQIRNERGVGYILTIGEWGGAYNEKRSQVPLEPVS
jgi:DNA-binding response OmpR family regulator